MSSFLPPPSVWPWLMIIAAAGIAVFVLLDHVGPKDALPAWRWGDPPRRPKQKSHLISQLLGATLACLFLSFAFA